MELHPKLLAVSRTRFRRQLFRKKSKTGYFWQQFTIMHGGRNTKHHKEVEGSSIKTI